jgi:hypothetical protein
MKIECASHGRVSHGSEHSRFSHVELSIDEIAESTDEKRHSHVDWQQPIFSQTTSRLSAHQCRTRNASLRSERRSDTQDTSSSSGQAALLRDASAR